MTAESVAPTRLSSANALINIACFAGFVMNRSNRLFSISVVQLDSERIKTSLGGGAAQSRIAAASQTPS
ncbi:MAG: hypothetical protein ACLQJ0_17505 [Steroidobacteraceae bacterium]